MNSPAIWPIGVCSHGANLDHLRGVEGLVILDGPNKLDARGVPGLGLVIL